MTTAETRRKTILAFVPDSSRNAVGQAAANVGLNTVAVRSIGDLLERLHAAPHVATLLSLSSGQLDPPLVERISEHAHSGTLLLSNQAVTLEGAFLMERVGGIALLREPLDFAEVEARLGGVASEGVEVPLPPWVAPTPGAAPRMVGSAQSMSRVFETLARAANTDSTVLVTGESGTGKEVVAKVLHASSARCRGAFVAVNCAAIPEHLLESELFGHERGAFTGAISRRSGKFLQATGGTLFLDEIGDMSLVLQSKVLRVLEERTLDPVGGDKQVEVDIRIVAATNRHLPARIAERAFREDLYYRLAVVELELPPLRERRTDVRSLALHFASEFSSRYKRSMRAITETALQRLEAYHWPGNVRELRNVLDRAVVLADDDLIRSSALRLGPGSPRTGARSGVGDSAGFPTKMSLGDVEADHIRRVLVAVEGHMGKAATSLGIHRNTLTRKVREYGLSTTGEEAG